MANMNIRTPRFYTDLVSYFLSRGYTQNGNFDVTATGGSGATATRGLQTGTEAELFDMKPLNKVDFDTGGDTDSQVLLTFDFDDTTQGIDYIAILNHNLYSSSGKIRIFAGDNVSDIGVVDGSLADTSDIDWGDYTMTEIVNADTFTRGASDKSMVIQPAKDGSTVFTFRKTSDDTSSTLRYWAIQFEGAIGGSGADTDETWGNVDLYVGNIVIGQYYDMPHAPDLAVKRSISFDGMNDVAESVGGQRYSNLTSHGRQESATTLSPFNQQLETGVVMGGGKQWRTYGGRIIYDMNFIYLNASDLMPDEYHTTRFDVDAVVEDIWNMTSGSHIPFIFSIDKDSAGAGAESEHIFARFGQNSLDMTQVANDVWNIQMRIEEEF